MVLNVNNLFSSSNNNLLMSNQHYHLTQEMTENYIKLGQLCRLLEVQGGITLSQLKSIINNDFDINYQLPSNSLLSQIQPEYVGNTVLHFIATFNAYKKSSSMCNEDNSCLELILKLGGDLTITNEEGFTPLIIAYHKGTTVYPLLQAQLQSNCSTNIISKNGISHLHIACAAYKDQVEVVDFFLKAGASVNERVNNDSPYNPGYTPLHFAAKNVNLQTIELLFNNGANINAKDAKGISPFHIIIKTFMELYDLDPDKFMKFSLTPRLINKDNFDDNVEVSPHLDFILYIINPDDPLLSQKVHIDSVIKSDSKLYPGCTPLHLASVLGLKFVIPLLLKGANILTKDAKGVTPFDMCLKKFNIDDIVMIFLNEKRNLLSQIKFTDGTFLVNVLQALSTSSHGGKDEFKQFLSHKIRNINTFIPFQSLIWPAYNILHLGVIFNTGISQLLYHNADFTRLNIDGSSPLHLAFCLNKGKLVDKILEAHKRVSMNPVNRNHLSHFHIACAAGHVEVIKLLLDIGADPNLPTLCDFQWDSNFDIYGIKFKTGSTPMHIAANIGDSKLMKILLDYKANPHIANASGVTPFQIALKKYADNNEDSFESIIDRIFEIEQRTSEIVINKCYAKFKDKDSFKSILNQIFEIDLETWTKGATGIKTLHAALLSSEKLDIIVGRLVQELDKKNPYEKLGLTRLQVACCIGDLTMVQEELKSGVDINQCISIDSSIWPGDSAMHILFRKNPKQMTEIAELLLEHGADPTLKNSSNSTPIHLCKDAALQKAISLLGNKFTSVNPINNEGLSHFHLCCKSTNVFVVEEFLKAGVNINLPVDYFAEKYAGWTPLHFALCYGSDEVVELLLNHNANHKIMNVDGRSPLHEAVYLNLANENRVEAIIRHSAMNIDDTSTYGDTVLMAALKSPEANENIVDLLLSKGASVNLTWFTAENIRDSNFIFEIANKFSQKIFEQLIAIIPAIIATDDMGENAFHYFCLKRNSYVSHSKHFKGNFKVLIENGCELNQKDNKGETALHRACCYSTYNIKISRLLLALGADVNIKSDTGKTPVEYAFNGYTYELKSILTRYLHNLEKIRLYLVESNSNTYLSIFSQHLQNFKYIELYFSESSETHLLRTSKELSRNIKREMEILDYFLKEEISPSFSAKYFFTEQFVRDYRRMQASRRQAIIINFRNFHDYLYELFPNLIPLFNCQLRKARTRTRLLEPAMTAFLELIDLSLPVLCLDCIFNYLSNEDLMNLIRAKNGKLEFAPLPEYC